MSYFDVQFDILNIPIMWLISAPHSYIYLQRQGIPLKTRTPRELYVMTIIIIVVNANFGNIRAILGNNGSQLQSKKLYLKFVNELMALRGVNVAYKKRINFLDLSRVCRTRIYPQKVRNVHLKWGQLSAKSRGKRG